MRIINYHVCIMREKASRKILKRKFTIWKRQQLGVIPKQGTILEIMRVPLGMEDLRMRSPSATLLAFCDDTEMQPQEEDHQ